MKLNRSPFAPSVIHLYRPTLRQRLSRNRGAALCAAVLVVAVVSAAAKVLA